MKNQSTINFTKMHGLGNDFMVIDALTQAITANDLPIQKWSHRYTGIGFDQLLLITHSQKADFFCRFFNADGSEAEQCGNGVRCVARYVHESGLIAKPVFHIETQSGIVDVNIHDYEHIEIKLGIPQFEKNKNILLGDHQESFELFVLSMGNPHAILPVESLEKVPVHDLGYAIATHQAFPQGVNVGFMQMITPSHILLRTYERGVGKTLACGSNACAAVAAGIFNKLLNHKVTVELELGCLQIEWSGEGNPVVMTGPAEKVFVGEVSKS